MNNGGHYHITWEIELHATSPEEAAKVALDIQRDSESIATVFDVTDEKGVTTKVDLSNDTE